MYVQCMSPVVLDTAPGLQNMSRGGIVFARLSSTHVNTFHMNIQSTDVVK